MKSHTYANLSKKKKTISAFQSQQQMKMKYFQQHISIFRSFETGERFNENASVSSLKSQCTKLPFTSSSSTSSFRYLNKSIVTTVTWRRLISVQVYQYYKRIYLPDYCCTRRTKSRTNAMSCWVNVGSKHALTNIR